MFIPLEPNAGPTGGEGFAAPPLICNLICPAISLAIVFNFDIIKIPRGFIQARNLLYYSRSTCEFSSSNGVLRPKILTITFSFFFLVVHLLDNSTKSVKRTIVYFYRFTDMIYNGRFVTHLLHLVDCAQHTINFRRP